MDRANATGESLVFFEKMVEAQDKHQQYCVDKCVSALKGGQLPTPKPIRNAINSLVGEKRRQALRHHPFWTEWKLRRGMASLVQACHQASIDICRHDAALGELPRSENFHEIVDHAVVHAAQKDVVAYCALAIGVRDTFEEIRRLRVGDIAEDISELKNHLFDRDISEFLRELRNNLLHGRVIVPQWVVSYRREEQDNTGSMRYCIEDLMQSGKWNERSRNFVSTLRGENMHLSVVVRRHFTLLNDVFRQVNSVFANNISLSEKDFFDIEDSYKREGRRQWAKVMVGQIATGKNPYEHLHRFFDPETVREILRRPPHSKEQVDFIMALKAAEIDWDDDLRNMMYQMFGVTFDSGS